MARGQRSSIWLYVGTGVAGLILAYVVTFLFILPPVGPAPSTEQTSNASEPSRTSAPSAQSPSSATLPEEPVINDEIFDTISLYESATAVETLSTRSRRLVAVPDLAGLALDDARTLLASQQLAVVVRMDTSSWHAPNTILRQMPLPGDSVPVNSSVTITASRFPPR